MTALKRGPCGVGNWISMPGRMPGGTLTPMRCIPGAGGGGGGAAGDAPWPCDPRELGVLGTEPEPDRRKNPMSVGGAVGIRALCWHRYAFGVIAVRTPA